MKKVVVSVITDLVTDQRVHKVSLFLTNKGCQVLLIGRRFKDSPSTGKRSYQVQRIKCYFRKGMLQYAEFNLRLFFKLLVTPADVFVSNDLDTLLPNYLVSSLRNKHLVYDSHEYFTGMPELKHRRFKRYIWKQLEGWILPKLKASYTVNDSIRKLYVDEYGIDMKVVRNLPLLTDHSLELASPTLDNEESGRFPPGRKILVMQGAGINQGRGYEEAIAAMKYLSREYLLVIIGSGLILEQLKLKVNQDQLQEKVMFIPRVPYNQLANYTKQAFLGLSLDKPLSLNNALSLPNKLFDYIHAGVPVLATSLIEVRNIVEGYKIGICIEHPEPQIIAATILKINDDEQRYDQWKKNTRAAARELHWDAETKKLDQVYDPILMDVNRS